MIKLLASILLTLIVLPASFAQTFIITDYKVSGCTYETPESIKKRELNTLGGKASLTFYDSKLKLTGKTGKESLSLILDKKTDNTYFYTEKNDYGSSLVTLEIEKFLGYIRYISIKEVKLTGIAKGCTNSAIGGSYSNGAFLHAKKREM